MLSRPVTVELITNEHRFIGEVHTHGQRLLDMLNNQTTAFLEINNVEVHRYNSPEECVAVLATALVRKADLHLVNITGQAHEAPTQRLYAFVQKKPYYVFLTVPGYEVRGRMQLAHQNKPDPVAVLTHETGTFFPVTQVIASQAWTGTEVFSYPVVMVNKHSLSLFHISEEPIEG